MFDNIGVLFDIPKVVADIVFAEDQAVIADMFQIGAFKVLLPVKGDVAALDDEILAVFNGGLDDLPENGPQISGQGIIVHGSQTGLSTADQPHFQMINGQVRIVVLLQKPLGQGGFSRMGWAGE